MLHSLAFRTSSRRRPSVHSQAAEALESRVLLTTFMVDTAVDVIDAGDGLTSLREAIQQANADTMADDIVFDASLNGQTITLTGTELLVTETLTISGPGSGLLTIDAGGLSRIFNLDGEAVANINVSIAGLTLTNGFVETGGGAAIVSNVNLSLDDVVVTDSMAGDVDSFTPGGGLFQFSPIGPGITTDANVRTLTIANSVFHNNDARGRGGALFLFGQLDASITDSVITDNSAWFEGGAIHTFFEESPEGVNPPDLRDLTLDIVGTTIDGNSSLSNQGRGGALYNAGSVVTILSSTISNNFGRLSGGAFFDAPTLTLTTTTIPQTTVVNSTVSGNSTDGDGGVKHGTSAYLFINSTLVLNRADADGNGSGEGGGLHGSAEAHNTILSGNVVGSDAGTPSDVSAGGTLFDSTFNLIGDADSSGGLTDGVDGNIVGNGGAGTIPLNTILNSNLEDNGGPTRTHALLSGSPALNIGSNAEAVDADGAALTTDQRGTGFPRLVAGIVDIGAFEASVTPTPVPGSPDIIGRASSGTIVVMESTGSSFTGHVWGGQIFAGLGLYYGDFNGDGLTDAAYLTGGGGSEARVNVMFNNGQGFSNPRSVGSVSGTKTYVAAFAGDYDGNGWDDHYFLADDGTWEIAVTTSSVNGSTSRIPGGGWDPAFTYSDVQLGDFNSDGLADVIGRNNAGHWVVGLSPGGGVDPELIFSSFGIVSTNVNWHDAKVGDFDGDGRSDIMARASSGTWVVGLSDGTEFDFAVWGGWSTVVEWDAVQIGDFNGDGMADVVGHSSSGRIVVGLSTGSNFSFSTWASISTNVTWPQIVAGDYNSDGQSDLALRASSGTWVVGLSDAAQFNLSVWGGWSTLVSWDDVASGDFVMV